MKMDILFFIYQMNKLYDTISYMNKRTNGKIERRS